MYIHLFNQFAGTADGQPGPAPHRSPSPGARRGSGRCPGHGQRRPDPPPLRPPPAARVRTMLPLVAAGLVALVALSYIVEALRPQPVAPARLAWAPDLPVAYADPGGLRLRYVTAGRGPALVLLHTLRTQLDMFEKVIPALAGHFTVYAVDLPGHG